MIVPRPRGWHLDERHLPVDGRPLVGGARRLRAVLLPQRAPSCSRRGSGPYFYLPKMECHLEARLWNDVFTPRRGGARASPHGTIRATVLIETITAAFEMDEILYELRDHVAGLNAGRWDYLFSIIKNFRDAGPAFMLPDRNAVTMTAPMMRAYTDLLVRTCHRRGAFAIGGMAAFIPSRRDAEVNERAFAKVREDKAREAGDGFDGSWVAHPDLVPLCARGVRRDAGRRGPTSSTVLPRGRRRSRPTTCWTSTGPPASAPSRGCAATSGRACSTSQAWLAGNGAVGIHNLMEDAATAEISRSQVWQWIFTGADARHRRPS